ncbi:MAG: ATP-dependent Clp protease proteolytic subunit [Oscillospiraceae bacterium]|jgi:ATP-dependent protease ClpP protease subunit|nr:ATP-dependent Clp protease proteolytic subunit [Oscillospiraceae bacterium]
MQRFTARGNEKKREEAQLAEGVNSFGSALVGQGQSLIHCLTIVGQVEGHQLLSENAKTTKYEHVMPIIAAVEESRDIRALLVLVNTAGGDVEAGLAIAELIAGMKKPTASIVLGGGHSIGVPLAVAAKKSYIAPSAAMTIHPVRLNGVVIAVPQSFNYFQRTQERVVKFIISNSRITREKLLDYMLRTSELANDVGSVVDAEDAVACGLIDCVGSLSGALDYLHAEISKAAGVREDNTD